MTDNICIIIPAAGASKRLGRPKQLVEFDGKTLIRCAVEASLEVISNVIVVTGCEDVAVREQVEDLPVYFVDNPDWEKGMGTSIAVGLRAAIDRFEELDGAIIHLCDLPLIDSTHIKRIADKAERSGLSVVYTEYSDAKGVPAFFGKSMFEELLFLDGDRGAKKVIEQVNDSERESVVFDGLFADIDVPEDLGELG
jgi:molybdenum cofactor cytidylyltransferase